MSQILCFISSCSLILLEDLGDTMPCSHALVPLFLDSYTIISYISET